MALMLCFGVSADQLWAFPKHLEKYLAARVPTPICIHTGRKGIFGPNWIDDHKRPQKLNRDINNIPAILSTATAHPLRT